MSLQDPIADMLTRIRNGQMAKQSEVTFDSSKLKADIAKVLEDEGYITGYKIDENTTNLKRITVVLKYYQERPVIERISRISKPSLRVYKSCNQLQAVPGFGVQILSTSQGVMSHLQAKKSGLGGEVICEIA